MYYSNFRCFTEKRERLSIFGRKVEEGLEIYIQKCSREDKFRKDYSIFGYSMLYLRNGNLKGLNELGQHPTVFTVPIEEGNTPKYTFIKYCKDNFFQLKTKTVQVSVLVKGDVVKPLVAPVKNKKVKNVIL